MQHPFFSTTPHTQSITYNGCLVLQHSGYISSIDTDRWYRELLHTISWRQDTVRVFGKTHRIPRLQAWYGERAYTYSHTVMPPQIFSPIVREIQEVVTDITKLTVDAALLNLYRTGDDSMGWHADNEAELDGERAIVSLSLGASRRFWLRPSKKHPSMDDLPTEKLKLLLANGDIVVMHPPMQEYTQHSLPKMKKVQEGRINITFRTMKTS